MTTNAYTFTADEATMRWEEPYLTRGLNLKAAVLNPAGVLRGCRFAGTATNCELQLVQDAVGLDHVVHYRTQTGYALTLRHLGSLLFDLTAYAGQTVIVAVYATYAVGVATTAFVRIYTQSEYNAAAEKPELVVLGRVTVSAGTPITVFEYTGRTVAALNESQGMGRPFELLRNGSFEAGVVANTGIYSAHFWEKRVTGGTGNWQIGTSPLAPGGSLKSLTLVYTSGSLSGTVLQYLHTPVRAGQILRLVLKIRVDTGSTGGTLELSYQFNNTSGAATGTVTQALDPATTTSSLFVTVEKTLVVPANVTHLRSVAVTATGLTYAGSGTPFFLDDLSLHLLEHDVLAEEPQGSTARMGVAGKLLLEDPTAATPQTSGALFHHVQADPSLVGSDKDGAALLLKWLGAAVLGEGLSASPLSPRITVNRLAANAYTLVFQWGTDSGYLGRLYLAGDGRLLITTNAAYTAGVWNRDTSDSATCFRLGGGVLECFTHPFSGSSSWSNTFNDASHWAMGLNVSSDLATVGGGTYFGSGFPNNATGADTPRLTIPATLSQTRSLLASIPASGWAVKLYRSFASGADTFELAINAVWGSAGAVWSQQAVGAPSRLFRFSTTGIDMLTQVDGAGPWADGAWASQAMRLSSVASPASSVAPIANTVSACQVAKAWGVVTTDGIGGATLVEGFNIDASELGFASGALTVGFLTDMPTANYVVNPSVNLTSVSAWKGAQATSHTTVGFLISSFAEGAGTIAQENLAAVARTIRFTVFAKE